MIIHNLQITWKKLIIFERSLILVIWLLFNGKQYPFCIQTLTIALSQLEPKLHPRLYHLRALCYLATEDFKNCIKDLERLLSLDHNFVDAYCIQGFVYMSQGDRLEAARSFKTYIEKANKDSVSYSHALYALATLTCQIATSLTTGNRNQVTQNLRYQQAYNYYQKAKGAEKRYEYLYGHTPDMIDAKRIAFIPEIADVKRNAMAFFEQKSSKETTKVEKDSRKEAEKLAILQQFLTSFPNGEQQQSEKKCNSCGSQTRKDLNGELDAEKKSKLLICARCSNVNYCSKECQKKDWKNGHKQTCTTAKTG
jgi:tetratricopeptide (TPR) repeat protein